MILKKIIPLEQGRFPFLQGLKKRIFTKRRRFRESFRRKLWNGALIGSLLFSMWKRCAE